MSKPEPLLYVARQQGMNLWVVDAICVSRRHTFACVDAQERALNFAHRKNAEDADASHGIYKIQRRWLEEHKISDGAGWIQRLRHRVYVWLNLPSNETGPP